MSKHKTKLDESAHAFVSHMNDLDADGVDVHNYMIAVMFVAGVYFGAVERRLGRELDADSADAFGAYHAGLISGHKRTDKPGALEQLAAIIEGARGAPSK